MNDLVLIVATEVSVPVPESPKVPAREKAIRQGLFFDDQYLLHAEFSNSDLPWQNGTPIAARPLVKLFCNHRVSFFVRQHFFCLPDYPPMSRLKDSLSLDFLKMKQGFKLLRYKRI